MHIQQFTYRCEQTVLQHGIGHEAAKTESSSQHLASTDIVDHGGQECIEDVHDGRPTPSKHDLAHLDGEQLFIRCSEAFDRGRLVAKALDQQGPAHIQGLFQQHRNIGHSLLSLSAHHPADLSSSKGEEDKEREQTEEEQGEQGIQLKQDHQRNEYHHHISEYVAKGVSYNGLHPIHIIGET